MKSITLLIAGAALFSSFPVAADDMTSGQFSADETAKAAEQGVKLLHDSLPQSWTYSEGRPQTLPSYDKWWQAFADPLLDQLMDKAESNNFNVLSALKRIEVAQKEVELARSAYFPQINASAGWGRTQNAGAVSGKNVPSSVGSSFSVGVTANWEIDLFGRVAAEAKAAKAGWNASRADYEGVMVALCASLAKAYINLRTYQAQYEVAMTHIASQEKVLKITEARFEAGIGDMLEVTQARIVLSSTKATIPGLESLIRSTINSIAVLCGEFPSELTDELAKTAPMPAMPPLPPDGVPADLLRRRPDVLQAEFDVAQLAAQAGVAKKDFLPTLSISGSISTEARRIDGLFGSHSLAYSVAPTLTWTVFDGLARNIRVAEAKLNMQAGVDNYNMTVLNAASEVENAMSRISSSIAEAALEKEVMELSSKSLDLSMDLYKRGLSNFTNVVDAQLNYLTYQNSYITANADAMVAMVELYEALGGGY